GAGHDAAAMQAEASIQLEQQCEGRTEDDGSGQLGWSVSDGMPAYGACCRRDVERPGVLVGQPVAGLVTQERVLLHADSAMSELHGLVGSRGRVAADLEQPVAGAGGGG